jgi:pimeloyl-ACP methyl ester carboxylesterase
MLSNPESLRGSFGFYRAWDATMKQNADRATRRLAMPVLAIGGQFSYGEHVGDAMKPLANDVEGVVIPGAGHWVAEQAPVEMLVVLTRFLAPYLERATSARTVRRAAAAAR